MTLLPGPRKVRAANVTARDPALDNLDVISGESATASEPVVVVGVTVAKPRRRDRGSPLEWVRGGGLTALAFALPMLVIFTAFSWYPITRLVVLSFQQTNLVDPATWVGLQNFREVIADPLFATAVKNTAYFAGLALLFGYPIPLIAAVLISESRRFRWQRTRLPAYWAAGRSRSSGLTPRARSLMPP